MSRLRQLMICLGLALALPVPAQVPAQVPAAPTLVRPATAPASLMPSLQSAPTPVIYFRNLLAMSAGDRLRSLTNRTPEVRAKILAKVREYQLLDPNERELRLQATELRWYLAPLMRLPAEQRTNRLAQLPDRWRDTVRDRLAQWDLLPPPLQQELLAHDQTFHYFTRVETNAPPVPDPRSEQLAAQFNQYFELTPAEKKTALNTLSAAERAQMEKTLQTFEKLQPAQRVRCLRNYATFAGMSGPERTEFLRNAGRWAQMTPAERQAWRDLVNHIPLWPPMPGPAVPAQLFPPGAHPPTPPSVATNSD